MPELPEVETVRAELERILGSDARIARAELMRPDIRFMMPKNLPQKLKNQPVQKIIRRAKYLLFQLPDGFLLNHLGMTGSWREVAANQEDPHDHFYLHIHDGRRLGFRDPRRFGLIDWIEGSNPNRNKFLIHLGPEPLADAIELAAYLFEKSRKRTAPIKNFLMDQKVLVGVGNIYAAEALFLTKIHPDTAAGKINAEKYLALIKNIQFILNKALKHGGSTIRDFKGADSHTGQFQNELAVYDRENEPCKLCDSPIRRLVQAGRSTFFCPRCQAKSKPRA